VLVQLARLADFRSDMAIYDSCHSVFSGKTVADFDRRDPRRRLDRRPKMVLPRNL
jgi:hypothetical protein